MTKKKSNKIQQKKMTRKEAIKKMGFTAFTGATMMLLLNNPAKAESPDSPDIPPEW